MGRGLIADPHWVKKVATGHEDDIRKCISCNIGCAGNRIGVNRPIRCTVNPTVNSGFDYKKKKVNKPCNVVGVAFNLVICIEFVKMLCKHTPDTLVEVMMFAIARQMIVEHTSPQQNLIVVLAIAILFAIKKFFFGKFDDIDKTVFLPTQRISSINELVHVEIPKETQHQTLGELLEKQIGTESGNFQVGQCYFFKGGALRVAKVKNGKITQIEVIRSKNAPVVLKR